RCVRTLLIRGFLGSLAVLLGGLITSWIPADGWVAQLGPVDLLRSSSTGRMLGLAVVVGGLGVLTASWFRLLRYVVGSEAGVSRVIVATVVWVLPLLLAPPLFSRDGWSYAAQGYLQGQGLSPYTWTPNILSGPLLEAVDVRWLNSPAPYGPIPLLWGGYASVATADPWLLALSHRAFVLVGLAMLAWAIPRLARHLGRDPGLAAWLVLPSPFMLAHGVGGVHNDVVMVGLMAVALVLAIERSWVYAALLGGLAAAVKIPGAFICIGVALVSLAAGSTLPERLRRFASVGTVAVAALVGAGIVAGVGMGWLHALGVPTTVETPLSISTVLGGLLQSFGWEGGLAVARGLGTLAGLGIAGYLALTSPTGTRHSVHAAAYAMLALTVLSPVVHPWYALWCIPLLAVLRLGQRGTSALVGVSLLLALAAPLDSSLEGAWVHIGMTTGMVVILAAAFLGKLPTLRYTRDDERELVGRT
ncbi:MAG TPA: polyprenol phosphomannose-dependent alpha 1,6 mannosyltransferase MptB, partial [Nocardioidaceae bacterium]|nr:polyprenol phosphomannose-dependent alpha 1,6 mannosyltransferase MptB [Nocardioidaceae bacterium]